MTLCAIILIFTLFPFERQNKKKRDLHGHAEFTPSINPNCVF